MGSYDKAVSACEVTGEISVIESLSEGLLQSLKVMSPNITDGIVDIVREKVSLVYANHNKQLKSMVISSYVRNYSDEELDAMINFYGSDLGKSILSKQAQTFLEYSGEIENYESEFIIPEVREMALNSFLDSFKGEQEDDSEE